MGVTIYMYYTEQGPFSVPCNRKKGDAKDIQAESVDSILNLAEKELLKEKDELAENSEEPNLLIRLEKRKKLRTRLGL